MFVSISETVSGRFARALELYEQKGNVAAAARLRDMHHIATVT